MSNFKLHLEQGDTDKIESIIQEADIKIFGPQFLQVACVMGKDKLVDLLVEKYKVDIFDAPKEIRDG